MSGVAIEAAFWLKHRCEKRKMIPKEERRRKDEAVLSSLFKSEFEFEFEFARGGDLAGVHLMPWGKR